MEVSPKKPLRERLAPLLGGAGAVLAASSWVSRGITRTWSPLDTALLAAGCVLLLIAAWAGRRPLASFFRSRRGKVGTNVSAMVAAAVALWIVANAISAREYLRRDLTAARKFSVGTQTRAVLDDLAGGDREIRITVLAAPGDILFDRVGDLLDTYAAHCKAVRLERIDPDFDPAGIRIFLERFGDLPNLPGVAFECAGRKKALTASDLTEVQRGPDGRPAPGAEPLFRGEQAITSAILSVWEERRPKVFVTQKGHDEGDIEGRGRYDFALFARELRLQNMEVLPLELPKAEAIPEDADLVAILRPDPAIPLEKRELFLLERYLEGGGHLLVMLEPLSPPQIEQGVADTLARWLEGYGARLPVGQIVVDPPASYRHPVVFKTSSYGDHEITRDLGGGFLDFYFARPVEPVADNPKGFSPTPLVYTDKEGWTETSIGPEEILEPRFDEGSDLRGPVALAIALEGPAPGEGRGEGGDDAKRARIVVLGDADLATNEGIVSFPNRVFLLHCVSWLARRAPRLSVPSRPFDERRLLDIGPVERRCVFWIAVVGLPAMVMALGLSVWLARRR